MVKHILYSFVWRLSVFSLMSVETSNYKQSMIKDDEYSTMKFKKLIC